MRVVAGTRSRLLAYTLLLVAGCGGGRAGDAGIDAPSDAAIDAPPDAVIDAPVDGGTDAPIDAGIDARPRIVRAAPIDARDDRDVEEILARGEIVAVERGHGGRSLGFRLTFADGTRAYFKPEQTFSGMHWYAEIAAYHLDRALGLRRTPVVVGRSIAWSILEDAAGDDPRVPEIVIDEQGSVRGAVVAWIEERLVPLRAPPGWERWIRIDPPDPITPFVSPRTWYRAVDHPGDAGGGELPAPEPIEDRATELSDLVVFDYLVHNADRWSANSTNVRSRGEGGPLVYLDQAAGFSPRRARLRLMDARLHAVQRFRRRTIAAVRALDVEGYARSLARDPLAPVLDERHLAHLEERRAHVIEHVDALLATHGEAQVYAW